MSEQARAHGAPALIPGWPPAWCLAIQAIGAFAVVLGACLFFSTRAAEGEQVARLPGAVTVAVQADRLGLESPDAAAARAAETLGSLPQVAQVHLLPSHADDRRIATLLRLRRDEPVRLLSVDLHPGSRAIGPIQADGYVLIIDDHRAHGPLEAGERRELAEAGVLAFGGLTLLLTAAAGGGTARIRSAIERVRLLSWLGASHGRLVVAAAAPCCWAATAAIWAGATAAAAVALRPGAGVALLVAPRADAVIVAAAITLLGAPLISAVAFAVSSSLALNRLEAP